MAKTTAPKPRKYNENGKLAYLNKKVHIKKPSNKTVAAVKQASATYKSIMRKALETPTARNREGILYKDLAEMLKARGKPLSLGKLVRLPKKQAMKLIKKYNNYDPVDQWKKNAYKTKSSMSAALGQRLGDSDFKDFKKKLSKYSPTELYSMAISKNYDVNKFLFSNSPNDVILQDGTVESVGEMESIILDMLEGAR